MPWPKVGAGGHAARRQVFFFFFFLRFYARAGVAEFSRSLFLACHLRATGGSTSGGENKEKICGLDFGLDLRFVHLPC